VQIGVAAGNPMIAVVIAHDVESPIGGLQRALQLHGVLQVHIVVGHAVNEIQLALQFVQLCHHRSGFAASRINPRQPHVTLRLNRINEVFEFFAAPARAGAVDLTIFQREHADCTSAFCSQPLGYFNQETVE
jgi:hypothetical protein